MDDSLERRITELIGAYADEIRDFTADLVAIPTENPPGRAYDECVRLIESRLRHLGIDNTRIEVPAIHGDGETTDDRFPRSCLLGFHGSGSRTLYFHGYYDVVPAANSADSDS